MHPTIASYKYFATCWCLKFDLLYLNFLRLTQCTVGWSNVVKQGEDYRTSRAGVGK